MSGPSAMSAVPKGPVPVPAAGARLADSRSITPVWRNELGGFTFHLGDAEFVKWVATGTREIDFPAEAERLTWASRWITVPEVIEQGADADGTWLVTAAVPGRSAVDPQ